MMMSGEILMLPSSIKIDVVSDVVCPWCYVGKARLEKALTLVPQIDVQVRWRPFFLNPWIPREGIERKNYLETKFGSVEAYAGMAARVASVAAEEGLVYNYDSVSRQPNTIDCHRLILWAGEDRAAAMKQAIMNAYFRDGRDLTDIETLVELAAGQGMDAASIRARLAGNEDVAMIEQQVRAASDAGVSGVPTFIFNDRYAMSGAQPAEALASAISRILTMPEPPPLTPHAH